MKKFVLNVILMFISLVLVSQDIKVNDLPGNSRKEKIDYLFARFPPLIADAPILNEKSFSLYDLKLLDGSENSPVLESAQFAKVLQGIYQGYLDPLQNPITKNLLDNKGKRRLISMFSKLAWMPEEESRTLLGQSIESPLALLGDQFALDANSDQYFQTQALAVAGISAKLLRAEDKITISTPLGLTEVAHSVQLNLGDGEGFRNIQFEDEIKLNFLEGGRKIGILKVVLTSGVYYARFAFEVEVLNAKAKGIQFNYEYQDPQSPTLSSFVYGNHGNGKMDKLVLFVEGVDLENAITAEKFFENGGINTPGSFIETLRENDYDIGYLDYKEGHLNSVLTHERELVRLLKHFNENPDVYEGSNNITIIGVDAGALVARLALSKMEKGECEEHMVRQFISYNGPFQGINMPVGLQFMIESLAFMSAAVDKLGNWEFWSFLSRDFDTPLDEFLNSSLFRELLVNHVDNQYGPTPDFLALKTELEEWGFPNKTKNSAIVLGNTFNNTPSLGGTPYSSSKSAEGHKEFFRVNQSPNWAGLLVDCYAKALSNTPGSDNITLARARFTMRYKYKILGIIPTWITVDLNYMDKKYDYHVLSPSDIMPGSFGFLPANLVEKYNENVDGTFMYNKAYNPQNHRHATFVSTNSALDVIPTYKNTRYIGKSFEDLVQESITPFDEILFNSRDLNHWHEEGFTGEIPINLLDMVLGSLLDFIPGIKSLPPNLSSEFNFTPNEGDYLTGVVIEDGGVLHINANKPSGFNFGPVPDNSSKHYVRSSNPKSNFCGGTSIVIEDGGVLSLGDKSNGNSGDLSFIKSGLLVVRSGGTLRLFEDSRIHLDGSSSFILEKGAIIELDGIKSRIECTGELVISGKSGRIYVSGKGELIVDNATIPLSSNTQLALSDQAKVTVGPNAVMEIGGTNTTILNSNQAKIEIQGKLNMLPQGVLSNSSDPGNENGYFIFNPSHPDFIQADGSSFIQLSGSNSNDVMLQVYAKANIPGSSSSEIGNTIGVSTELDNVGVFQADFLNGKIEVLGDYVMLNNYANGVFSGCQVEGFGNMTKVRQYNQLGPVIEGCNFQSITMEAWNTGQAKVLQLRSCDFSDADFVSTGYLPLVTDINLELKSDLIFDKIAGGIAVFDQVIGRGDNEMWVQGITDVDIKNCFFQNSVYPLHTQTEGRVQLKCNTFLNVEGAIENIISHLDLSGSENSGGNKIVGRENLETALISNGINGVNGFGFVDFFEGNNYFQTKKERIQAYIDFNIVDSCYGNNTLVYEKGNQWDENILPIVNYQDKFQFRPVCESSGTGKAHIQDHYPEMFEGCSKESVGPRIGTKNQSFRQRINQITDQIRSGVVYGYQELPITNLSFFNDYKGRYLFKHLETALVNYLFSQGRNTEARQVLENLVCLFGSEINLELFPDVLKMESKFSNENGPNDKLKGYIDLRPSRIMQNKVMVSLLCGNENKKSISASRVIINPNPFSHEMFFELTDSELRRLHKVVVRDYLGRVVMVYPVSNASKSFQISNLEKLKTGVYFLEGWSTSEKIFWSKGLKH